MSNTTTKTNTTFRGIKANVQRTNNSLSAGNIERLQRKAMKKLYQDEFGKPEFYVVETVSIDDVGNIERGYQVVGKAPVVTAFGELNNKVKQIEVKIDRDGNTRQIVTGPT